MLETLRRLLGAENETSASLKAALAEIDLDALHKEQARIGSERQGLLLTGTNEQVLDAERRLDVARLDIERAQIAHDALTARLRKAESEEADTAIRSAVSEATKARDAYLTKLGRELPKIGKTIDDLVSEGNAITKLVSAANRPFFDDMGLGDRLGVSSIAGPRHDFGRSGKLAELPSWLIGHFDRNLDHAW